MSNLPYGTRFYRGKISATAKHSGSSYTGGSATQVNKELTQKANFLSIIVASVGQQLNKIPFYRLFRPQSRSQGRG